jgi:hypothetical protein
VIALPVAGCATPDASLERLSRLDGAALDRAFVKVLTAQLAQRQGDVPASGKSRHGRLTFSYVVPVPLRDSATATRGVLRR